MLTYGEHRIDLHSLLVLVTLQSRDRDFLVRAMNNPNIGKNDKSEVPHSRQRFHMLNLVECPASKSLA